MPGFNLGMGLGLGESRAPFARNPIAALFTTGVNGAWYDPSDFSTMFQDAAGTTPVTAVGQPVGLMLDKSKGLVLGPELVTNGDFATDTAWTKGGTWTISGGVASWGGGADAFLQQSVTATAGTTIRIEFTLSGITSGSVGVRAFNTISTNIAEYTRNGTYVVYDRVSSASGICAFRSQALNAGASVDKISVRELPGNHAFNSSGNSANFPVLSARYNLLTKTEDFSDAVWGKASTAIISNAVIAPDNTLSADKLVEAAATAQHFVASPAVSLSAATSASGSVYVKAAERTWCVVRFGYQNYGRYVNLSTGAIGSIYSAAPDTFTVDPVGDGWFKITLSKAVASGNIGLSVDVATSDGTNNYAGDGTSGIYIWGADLRVANDAMNQPAYQRVNTATDYDTVGFKPYLSFNGVNQWLQTNSIDFTYGDKMFVCAGVRKLSDAGTQMISELSTDAGLNNGFYIASISNTIYSKLGTPDSFASFPFATSPASGVVSCVYDKTKTTTLTSIIARINGTPVAGTTMTEADALGNFSNNPLYIGARAGTSLFFNGRLYGLVVAGKQASANEIASTEAWLNQKTGAY